MKQAILLACFVLQCTFTTLNAQDWKTKILKDVVTVQSGKYTMTEYTLVTFSNGNTVQVKTFAEAPATGVISRDYFVEVATTIKTYILMEFKKQDSELKTQTLDEMIGKPDLTMNFFMSKNGIQVETLANGETERKTILWSELLKD